MRTVETVFTLFLSIVVRGKAIEDYNNVTANVPLNILSECRRYSESCKTYGDNCEAACTVHCISDIAPDTLRGGSTFLSQMDLCLRGKDNCLNPRGTDCSFYSNCLAKQFPSCVEDSGEDYAKLYCQKFQNNYFKYSSKSQSWINGVRRCLQTNLAKTIVYDMALPCSELHDIALAQQVRCYSEPNVMESICDLPAVDVWKLFWTVKSSFVSSYSNTIYSIWRVVDSCGQRKSRDYKEKITNSIKHVVLTLKPVVKTKDAGIDPAIALIDELTDKNKFDKNFVNWFAFGEPNSSPDTKVVHIFFADPGIVFDGKSSSSYEFQYAMNRFHRALIVGKKISETKFGSTYQVRNPLLFCDNVFCR